MITLTMTEKAMLDNFILNILPQLPLGQVVYFRDFFPAASPRIARRLYEEVVAGMRRLALRGSKSSDGYLVV